MAVADISPSCCAEPSAFLQVESARRLAISGVEPAVGEEIVPLGDARGRIALVSIRAPQPVPPFRQSAMDGYAVRTADLSTTDNTLPVVARQIAGPAADLAATYGAVRIFTGAAVPAGYDAVVMQEQCTAAEGVVSIRRPPKTGEHIRPIGDDIPAGAVLIESGTLIDARHVAVLAAAGVPEVRVRRRIRVALLSTGNELREPGEPLGPGEIHDSNRTMLLSLIQSPAVQLADLGRVHDGALAIGMALAAAAAHHDVIITTGGVSVGDEDHLRAAVEVAGGRFMPLKASIKPGKPASVGRIATANLIALPGNPVSALVTYLWFGKPILLRRMGLEPGMPRPLIVAAGFDEVRRPCGRDEFVPVAITGQDSDGCFEVEKRRLPGSARLSSLIGADGLARIPGHCAAIKRGERLNYYPFAADFAL